MAKTSVSDWDATASNNTDIDGVDISGTTGKIKDGDNAIRSIMSQVGGYTRRGADLASAATLNLDSIDTLLLNVTGTTTVTAVTLTSGHWRIVRATGAFHIAPSASLIVNGSTTVGHTCVAGDELMFEGYASSVVRVWTIGRTRNGVLPKGHLYDCTLSNNATDATNDIDIAAGQCRDSTDVDDLVLASAITKQLDVVWAVGTNAGMLDTGTIADSTYHIWLIKRPDTGVVDVLASTSASAPTMPTNYTLKRRIGAIIRSSAAILAFKQRGDTFLHNVQILNVSAANPGTAAVTRVLTVPIGVVVDAIITAETRNTGTAVTALLITPLVVADTAPSVTAATLVQNSLTANAAGGVVSSAAQIVVRTDESGQVRSRLIASDANITLYIGTDGWIDTRGRDA